MPKRNFTINWSTFSSLEAPKEFFHWPEESLRNLEEDPIEESLDLAPGTLSVLNIAFEKKLSRHTGWKSQHFSAPLADASRVFRRGVFYEHVKTDPNEKKITEGSYPIIFKDKLSEVISELSQLDDYFFVVDKKVAGYFEELRDLSCRLMFESSEFRKDLKHLARILANPEFKKSQNIVVIGGGVLSDLFSFAASISKKNLYLVPTTLLAMADASVGGKTGVNYPPYGKNQIGSFYFPKAIYVFPEFIKTLLALDFRSGLAECFKHAFLSGDPELIEALKKESPTRQLSVRTLEKVIRIKADIVEKDPLEKNLRATLNFGHTIAHALEGFSQEHNPKRYIRHGEAVAVGMIFEAALSREVLGLSHADFETIDKSLRHSECLLSPEEFEVFLGADPHSKKAWQGISQLILQDKKNESSQKARFSLLKAIGKPAQNPNGAYTFEIDLSLVEKLWFEFSARYMERR